MKIFFLIAVFMLLPILPTWADELSFPEDLPTPKNVLDLFLAPMEPLNFTVRRAFTITMRGPNCRHYQWALQKIAFTICIRNRHENNHWIQRMVYQFPNTLPTNIVIEHSGPAPISHENLWNWRFPPPAGNYYALSAPELGFSARYEKKSSEITFHLLYAEETFTFLETTGDDNKIMRIYQGSFLEGISECKATVIRYNGIPSVYYQIDQGSAMAPYLFREQCLSQFSEQFAGAGEHFQQRFKQRADGDN